MGKRGDSFEVVQKSVARVKDSNGQTWGTGFFISREGHLLTCAHVVQDAGGWKNVRILDQPVNCLYAGDPERDDFCLLQVEDLQVIPVELGKDFDPGDEFLSFGFSNDDFYGAPIRGEITAFARCGRLGDQKLIRLETFSDAQRIEGGQSGAPIVVYKRGKFRVVGLIAASEDSQGGLAIAMLTILQTINFGQTLAKTNTYQRKLFKLTGLFTGSLVLIGTSLFTYQEVTQKFSKCSSEKLDFITAQINDNIDKGDNTSALSTANHYIQICNDPALITIKSRVLIENNAYEQAIQDLRLVLREPKLSETVKAQAQFNLGRVLAKIGDYSKAIEQFQAVEEDSIFKLRAYYNIGVCNYELRKFDEAIHRFEFVVNFLESSVIDSINTNREKPKISSLYSDSLYYLTDINAKLWYENRNTSKSIPFKEDFLNFYYANYVYVIKKNIATGQAELDIINRNMSPSSKIPLEYSYIYKTQEFKNLLCRMYKDVGKALPNYLIPLCKT